MLASIYLHTAKTCSVYAHATHACVTQRVNYIAGFVDSQRVSGSTITNAGHLENSKIITNNNSMLASIILEDESKYKYYIGLLPTEFNILYNFLGPAKFELTYWKHRSSYKKVES